MIDPDLLARIIKNLTPSRGEGGYSKHLGNTVGVVVDTDDPLQQGRLRIFCPSLNDDPNKLHHLPWASYCSPMTGMIDNSNFTRGAEPGKEKSSGSMTYGWWAIPEQGAHAIVTCIDGDSRRRVWIGCLPEHQETNTILTGRYKHENGEIDGPLTGSGEPLNPQYTNLGEAFKGERGSAEWKTRGANYQACAVPDNTGQVRSVEQLEVDALNETMAENETDDWVKKVMGAHGYDWSSNKSIGSFLASKVFGFSTPGGHSIIFDDRAFNSRISLRTVSGHQMIFDDTNERIYVSTSNGKSWVEMDKSGNIDMFSDRRFSLFAKDDVNISTDGRLRFKAKKGIDMYAGDKRSQTPLTEVPPDGQIRLHSTDDFHVFSEKNFRLKAEENGFLKFGENLCLTVGDSFFTKVMNDINTITESGDFNSSIASTIRTISQGGTNYVEIGESGFTTLTSGAIVFGSSEEVDFVTSEDIDPLADFSSGTFSISEDSEKFTIEGLSGFGVNCIELPGSNIRISRDNVDLDVLNDIGFKVKSAASPINESIANINGGLNLIENRFNKAIGEIVETFGGILNDPFNFPIPSLPDLPPITINGVINSINLPTFNFPGFCVPFDTTINNITQPLPFGSSDHLFGDGPSDPIVSIFEQEGFCEDKVEPAIWTNRVPQHEPWPRVLKQDSDDPVNEKNEGYKNNVDWIDQFDNVTSPEGREPIGKVEGEEDIERNMFWRR